MEGVKSTRTYLRKKKIRKGLYVNSFSLYNEIPYTTNVLICVLSLPLTSIH
jgi:hypothetical protein